MKRIVAFFLIFSLAFLFFSCNNEEKDAGKDAGYVGKNTESVLDTKHSELLDSLFEITCETAYSELYSLYCEAVVHRAEHQCGLNLASLCKNMLYGKWIDDEGNYISYTYVYKDYNNTTGDSWYRTNLPTSKISGNTYYYYTRVDGTRLVIGYQDKITEEKTDNFVIAFHKDSITVQNKNNDKEYRLDRDKDYVSVEKGNAKLAYVYIAKRVFDFNIPNSVVVTACAVDYETKTVYATIQANNSYGGAVAKQYKLYETNNQYYMEEYSHNYSTNIDLEELNQKLQAYVSSGK